MPWNHLDEHAGFSQAKTWLPIPAAHKKMAVSLQEDNSDSILNAYRTFMRWRKTQPAVRLGDIQFITDADDYLVFIRHHEDENILCAFNFSASAKSIALDATYSLIALAGHGCHSATTTTNLLDIPAYSAFIARKI